METQIQTINFLKGLQTTALGTGLEFPAWTVFDNVRVDQGVARRRLGRVLVDRGASNQGAMTFAGGSSQSVAVQTSNAHTLGKEWTIELLYKVGSVTGTQTIIGFADAANWPFHIYQDGTTLKVVLKNAGAAASETLSGTTTLAVNDTIAVQVKRSAADVCTLTYYTIPASGTAARTTIPGSAAAMQGLAMYDPAVSMQFGTLNGSNYFTGTIDYFRGFSICRSHHKDGFIRWPDPWCSYCLWDYDMKQSSSTITDRSRWGNNGLANNSPTDATTLALQTAPVQAMVPYVTQGGTQRLLAVMGGGYYDQEIR